MSTRISVLVVSDSLERLQMAAMIASVGAVSGHAVTVFLSMNALPQFRKGVITAAPSEGQFGRLMLQKGAPPFRQLFEQAVELGDAKIHPCSMAMDLLGYDAADIEPYIGEAMGLTKFLDEAGDGQVWTF